MKKKIGIILIILLAVVLIGCYLGIQKFNEFIVGETPNYLVYQSDDEPIGFEWTNDSIGNYYETKTAIFVPLTIEGLAHQFYMQLDTGSPHTFIYENSLNVLKSLGVDVNEVTIGEGRYIEHLDFSLDSNKIKASTIKIYPNYGRTFEHDHTLSKIPLGTIGSDFLADRITTIDFKNQKIQFFDQRPSWMQKLTDFKPFDFTARRRIMLPVALDNKNYEFLYDSGCSAFGLITIKSRYDQYTDKNIEPLDYGANSWGSSIPIISKPSDKRFSIGNTNLSLRRVSYVDMYTITQPWITPFTRMGGWLGNRPFTECMMVLDTKKEEFIVIE